ncbi:MULTISPECIES: DNA polymerase III subunit chi [Methylotenera]|uniref:DNA polymerase III subunit chi n=1 Tax=Methylotenera TaxID=359407 RepID=UPI000377B75C|nr:MULTISPECIES: DNA polymerase III subunit chi [Methylotenera]
MTRIEFYSNVADKKHLLLSLTEKALGKHRQVTVFTEDATSAADVSDCLWQHQPASFLPNVMADNAHVAKTPIIIVCKTNAAGQMDNVLQDELLINLTPQEPPFFSRFTHLIELVGIDESDKLSARQRYKFYRDRGYEIQHIDHAKNADT